MGAKSGASHRPIGQANAVFCAAAGERFAVKLRTVVDMYGPW
jgi:hypothetical protein